MSIEALTAIGSGPGSISGSAAATGAKIATDSAVVADAEKLAQSQPALENQADAVQAAARQIDSYLKSVGQALEFSVDQATGRTVVTVRETATGDVIRQIPNEEVLELARHLDAGPSALLNLTV
ncbi:MAG TPA: flagellar protein FlaG [Steroidobacteraceae bacterium]|jgi:flagellar protein FlaG